MALTESKEIMIGTKAPSFKLKGVDGKIHSFEEISKGKKATVVMFICNHCPYVKAYFDRLIALTHEYQKKETAFVGINSNDETNYPDDSFEKMVTLAKRKELPFLYLRDHDQQVAKAYDAVCTPEVYVADSTNIIRYHGGIDDSWDNVSNVTKHYLKNALDDILANRTIQEPTPHAMGCSIKWA
ncbi:MAG: hypothetical protein A3I05_01665 [Deltaproteobacteria bacterium RIFCSPLOWO2_02_FULL_44_10]|nr:MAG: hypothetical protein A3C46_05260 [Deltaproteobacteria bacterium RIFCSPHIGHO2_02_FULL_44_16]OGQ45357.1 MAG: hypothetical protein A3I05_01665 [Deltaproteobacteria bacterium RIFCSPLOWO2_02_FULL_44_10]